MRTTPPPVYTEIAAIHARIAAGGTPPAHTAACATCGHDLGPVDTHAQAVEVVLDCGGRVDPDGSLVCPECVEDTMTGATELPIGTGKTRALHQLGEEARQRGLDVIEIGPDCRIRALTDLPQALP